MNVQHVSFVILVAQNTAMPIMSKWSRHVIGPKYNPTAAVLLVEALKFLLCTAMVLKLKNGSIAATVRTLRFEVFADRPGLMKMAVLAFLYALQNIFALVAYDFVDVATYQIVYQLKIIATALFMRMLLHRRFSAMQWIAMFILVIGVAVCSYSQLPVQSTSDQETQMTSERSRVVGIGVVLGLAVNSGLAAAYLERVMKTHEANETVQTIDTLWSRNLQLSVISVGLTSIDLLRNFEDIRKHGFFSGFHVAAYVAIALQAIGGLTIAAVVRYSDNIVKNFGSSISLILSCVISNYMGDTTASAVFYFGAALVIVAVFVYSDRRFAVSPTPAKISADEEVDLIKPAMKLVIESQNQHNHSLV